MPSLGALLGGILTGAGGIGTATEQGRQDALKQQQAAMEQARLNQQQTYQDALVSLERDKLAQANANSPLALEALKQQNLQNQGARVAAGIEAKYPPMERQGPVQEGQPPLPSVSTLPPRLAALTSVLRAGLADKPADLIAQEFPQPKLESVVDPETGRTYLQPFDPQTGQPTGERTLKEPSPSERLGPLMKFLPGGEAGPGGSTGIRGYTPTLDSSGKLSFHGQLDPPQYRIAENMVREKLGLAPGMPGYDTAFFDAVSQLTPVTEGGGAATRSQGVRLPGQTPGPTDLAIKGPPKTINETGAQQIANAVGVRSAANQVMEALNDPAVKDYVGPFAQYYSKVQGMTPNEGLGKIPPSVVAMEQNMARIKNYTVKLITGAQMSEVEAKRIMAELPDQSQQPDVMRQRLQTTMANNARTENIVRSLALRGDTNALAIAAELGLNQQAPAPNIGGPGYTGLAPASGPPRAPAPAGKIWIEAPDGTPGYWPAQQAIPQGYRRLN